MPNPKFTSKQAIWNEHYNQDPILSKVLSTQWAFMLKIFNF